MASIPALAEPSVLRWARATSGVSVDAVAVHLNVHASKIYEWEEGVSGPTVAELKRLASIYNRAISVFFLPEPPYRMHTLRDFRRVAGSTAGSWSASLHVEYRRAHTQRDNLLELHELNEEEPSRVWQIRAGYNDNSIATMARNLLLSVSVIDLPNLGTPHEHLNTWISGMEQAGILVLTTSGGKVSVSEMRAFSLYFDGIPVVMLNGADSPRGRLFSLIHEYAHLLLHSEGLCDTLSDLRATTPTRQLEARCNAIAADILMPRNLVIRRIQATFSHIPRNSWSYESLSDAARPFGVSAEAFLLRLVSVDLADSWFYDQERAYYQEMYEQEEQSARPTKGNSNRTLVRDLGKSYVRQVLSAHERHTIDTYTAASFLNAKVERLPKLAEFAATGAT